MQVRPGHRSERRRRRAEEEHQDVTNPHVHTDLGLLWAEGASTLAALIEALQQASTQLRAMANAGVTLHEPVRHGHVVLSARDAETAQRFNMTREETTTRDRTRMDDEHATAVWDNEGSRSGGDDAA